MFHYGTSRLLIILVKVTISIHQLHLNNIGANLSKTSVSLLCKDFMVIL